MVIYSLQRSVSRPVTGHFTGRGYGTVDFPVNLRILKVQVGGGCVPVVDPLAGALVSASTNATGIGLMPHSTWDKLLQCLNIARQSSIRIPNWVANNGAI